MKLYLLENYKEYSRGDIITVTTNTAFGLIDSKKARKTENKDFLIKPENTFGSTIKTRAFGKVPYSKKFKKINK